MGEPSSDTLQRCVLALGSNIGDREENLYQGLSLIREQCGEIERISSIFETSPLPVPHVEQGAFFNLTLILQTSLSPKNLLEELLQIERTVGRDRSNEIHWGPRVLDIDIITFGNHIQEEETLTIPHALYHDRDFVLLPLKEMEPDFCDPVSGSSIDELFSKLASKERTVIRSLSTPQRFLALL